MLHGVVWDPSIFPSQPYCPILIIFFTSLRYTVLFSKATRHLEPISEVLVPGCEYRPKLRLPENFLWPIHSSPLSYYLTQHHFLNEVGSDDQPYNLKPTPKHGIFSQLPPSFSRVITFYNAVQKPSH